jgi:hypothetical protein
MSNGGFRQSRGQSGCERTPTAQSSTCKLGRGHVSSGVDMQKATAIPPVYGRDGVKKED